MKNSNQRGLALTEIMLGTAIVALLAYTAAPLLVSSLDDRQSKATADDFGIFQEAAAAHFKANRSAYESAMQDGTGATNLCKIGVNPINGSGGLQANNTTLHTCAVDASMLRFLQALPTQVQSNNRYGEQWVAIFKQVYTTVAPIQPTGGVEMLVVSAKVTGTPSVVTPDKRRFSQAVNAADFTGGNGGFIPDANRSTCVVSRTASIYEACGNGWKVNLANFISPTQLATFSNRVTN